jgi:hypothetical protein
MSKLVEVGPGVDFCHLQRSQQPHHILVLLFDPLRDKFYVLGQLGCSYAHLRDS